MLICSEHFDRQTFPMVKIHIKSYILIYINRIDVLYFGPSYHDTKIEKLVIIRTSARRTKNRGWGKLSSSHMNTTLHIMKFQLATISKCHLTCTSITWIESQQPLILADGSGSPAFRNKIAPAKPWSKSHR